MNVIGEQISNTKMVRIQNTKFAACITKINKALNKDLVLEAGIVDINKENS